MTAVISPRSRRLQRLAALAAASILATALGACDFHRLSSEEALIESTPAIGHRIGFVDRDEVLDIEVPPGHRGLSHNQYVDVYRFAVRYREESTGPLVLTPPSARHGDQGWRAAVADVRRALRDGGVDPARIVAGRPVGGSAVTLAFQRPLAVAPQCGSWPRDAGRERERINHHDFGCATQRNLAGMVANSRDLISSQAESPASSERRGRIWSQYVSGDSKGEKSGGAAEATEAKPKGLKK